MKYDIEELLKENMDIQGTPSRELNERILYHNRGGNRMQNKKYVKFMPKVALVALAAVAVTGGIGYAAVNLWDRSVAEDFGVAKDLEMMQEMNDKGFAQQPQVTGEENDQVSVTDKDITVTLKQTLADEHSAYVCYEVKYGDQYKAVDQGVEKHLDYGIAMPWTKFQMDSGISLNHSGGVKEVVDDHTVLYEYFITTSRNEDTLDQGKMKMSLSDFWIDLQKADPKPKVIAKGGNWDLSWDLSVGTEKRIYHLDQTLTLGKYRVVVKDLIISPLSYTVTIGRPDGVSFNDIFAVVKDSGDEAVALNKNGDMKVIRYVRTNEEDADQVMKKLPKGQTLISLDSVVLRLGGKDFDGMGGMGNISTDYVYGQFDKVLDLEKVTGTRVAGKYIDLKSVSYDTVK